MAARGSFVAANAMVDALRRGDEAKAEGLIDRVTGAAESRECANGGATPLNFETVPRAARGPPEGRPWVAYRAAAFNASIEAVAGGPAHCRFPRLRLTAMNNRRGARPPPRGAAPNAAPRNEVGDVWPDCPPIDGNEGAVGISSMHARGSFVAANAMVDALRRGDEAMAVGLIDRVTGAADLGLCLLRACETGHPTCTRLLLAAHAAVDQADSN